MKPSQDSNTLAAPENPMSVLGITDGLAAVEGKEMAEMFAAAPQMLKALRRIAEYEADTMSGYDCKEIARQAVSWLNAKGHSTKTAPVKPESI